MTMLRGNTICLVTFLVVNALSRPYENSQEYAYRYGNYEKPFLIADSLNLTGRLANGKDFIAQVLQIQMTKWKMFEEYKSTYQALDHWIMSGADLENLDIFIEAFQMRGIDNESNFLLTGYYTPELQVRKKKDGEFRFPIYCHPPDVSTPEPEIDHFKTHEDPFIGYCNSIFDIAQLKQRGFGYVDHGDNGPVDLYTYVHPGGYNKSILDCVPTSPTSFYTRKKTVIDFGYKITNSFAVLKPLPYVTVRGAFGIPLVDKVAVAVDSKLIPPGTPFLVEVPIVGNLVKDRYEYRVLLALDQGVPPITGFHLEMYFGKGLAAREKCIKQWHYVRAWELEKRTF